MPSFKLLLFCVALFIATAFRCEKYCTGALVPFRFTGWALKALDNRGAEPVEVTDGQALRTAFGIRIFSNAELSSPLDTLNTEAECREYRPDSAILGIRVNSLTDFDSSHPAGSDISNYWVFRVGGENATLGRYVNYLPLPLPGPTFNRFEPVVVNDLLLLTAPAAPGSYQFSVTLQRSDSSVFHLLLPPVQLH